MDPDPAHIPARAGCPIGKQARGRTYTNRPAKTADATYPQRHTGTNLNTHTTSHKSKTPSHQTTQGNPNSQSQSPIEANQSTFPDYPCREAFEKCTPLETPSVFRLVTPNYTPFTHHPAASFQKRHPCDTLVSRTCAWKCGRADYCTCLENRRVERHRGFKSHHFRKTTTITLYREH